MVQATYHQPFIGIWFHDKKLSTDQQDRMKLYLNRTFYYYRIFVDMIDFYSYIDEKKLVTRIFLIISISDLSLFALIKLAQDYPQFFEKVYVFSSAQIITSACFHTTDMDKLLSKISDDIIAKIDPLNLADDELSTESKPINTSRIDKVPPSLSVFNEKITQSMLIRHLTKETLKFVSFLIIRDILIKKSYAKRELTEMCTTCRSLHKNNVAELKNIDHLQITYKPNEAIQNYTKSSFLFRAVNRVCGTENIEEIYKFRIYISDLHKQLHQFDMDQNDIIKPYIEKVYRGKPVAGSVLQKLVDNKGGLISMNGFLSTTIDRKVASIFAGGTQQIDEGHERVLFEFKIDQKIKLPFAYISECSTKRDESEVLFSLGTIWCIESIKNDMNLYTIELTPCKELDPELDRLLRKYTDGNVTLISLGDILCEFGDEGGAEWCYRKMLDEFSDDDEATSILYYKIGMIQFEKKIYSEALANLEKAESYFQQSKSKLNETTTSRPIYIDSTGPRLLSMYNNIGFILQKNDKFEEAVKNYEQALEEKGDDSELATVHNNLGLLQFHLGNYATAHKHHAKASELISESHPWSIEFKKSLKYTEDYLAYIAKNEEKDNH